MANIKSQKKRIITSRKENANNTSIRTFVKTTIKKYEAAISAGDVALAKELLPKTVSVIDSAKSDGIFKDNTASRKVARLSKLLYKLETQGTVEA